MRILLLYMMLLMGSLNGWAQQRVTYQRADSLKICRLLRDANKQTTTLWFARQFLNIPYVAHTLEVNPAEQLVVNTRQLDCTTLVETVTALTLCAHQGKRSWNDYLSTLRTLRYRKGKLDGYPSRLHYFSDWIADKTAMSIVKEIQSPNPPFSAVQHINVNYMSTHPDAYQALKAHPEWVSVIRQQEETLSRTTSRYIPKSVLKRNTKALRQAVHDGDIIAITCNKKGLDIAHLGFAVWKKDGLHLLNASQIHKKVVQEPMTLYQYLQKHPSHTGIRIIRIN
ncbi:Protein of unknown function [Prevotellaceae bacterium MN60]|nr:Protein of unknown function [Prevotellaceae bacterium MN60]